MPRKKIVPKSKGRSPGSPRLAANAANSGVMNPARIYAVPQESRYLDPTELAKLERAFRSWAKASSRPDVSVSRKRILMIFLLIRYTGPRLNEVLALDLRRDFDASRRVIRYRNGRGAGDSQRREVEISSDLVEEIQETLDRLPSENVDALLLTVDAGHVRRKFYERAVACGFAQDLGSPNAIRKARAVELMQNNMPLPVVQRILGHSTPNLTASLIAFSEEDMRHVARHFVEKEGRRKTSARNTFFGKIRGIRQGDIQSQVELVTLGGNIVTTVITNNSLKSMGLKAEALVTAEIKAPWVVLQKADTQPLSTAENVFQGTIAQIRRGKLTSEFIVRIQGGTELCSLVTEESRRRLGLKEQDKVWAVFNSFSVILRVD